MKNIIILIGILIYATLSAQDPTLEFKKTLNTYQMSSMIKTKDGNFMFTGYSKDLNPVDSLTGDIFMPLKAVYITKLDKEGDLLWTKFLSDGKSEQSGQFIAEGESGFLILINGSQLIKVDYFGNKIWEKNLGEVSKLISSDDGGYIVSGSFEGGKVWLYKLSDAGEIQWKISQDQYKIKNITNLIRTIDNQFILLDNRKDDKKNNKFYLVKFKDGGSITWEKELSPEIFSKSRYNQILIQDKFGNYIIASDETYETSSDYRITKWDEQGNLVFSKIYGLMKGDYYSKSIKLYEIVNTLIEAENGGYIIGGKFFKIGTRGLSYGYLFRIDDQGRFLWSTQLDIDKFTSLDILKPIEKNKFLIGINNNHSKSQENISILTITDNFDAKYDPMLCPLVE